MIKYLAAASLLLATTSAHALPVFSSGSIALQMTTSSTGDLATEQTFSIGGVTLVSGTGDFAAEGGAVSMSPTLSLLDATTFDFSASGFGSFVAGSPVTIIQDTSRVLSFSIVGTYTVGSDFSNAGLTGEADETFSLTQTGGPGNAISISGTDQVEDPVNRIPEPGTVAIFGAALLMLGGVAFGAWCNER